MTTNHIDQLAQWYAEAEQITKTNLPCAGDALIFPYNAGGYAVEAEEDGWTPDDVVPGESVRILDRAPKPKPAWHDAVAVIAEVRAFDLPRVFVKDYNGVWNDALTGRGYSPDALSHVTPLIEAKVTDETARTVLDRYYETETGHDWHEDTIALMRLAVTAALGLESA